MEIRTRRPMLIDTDGEITTQTPARFHVEPAALEVLAPVSGNQVQGDLAS